jgi:hypothetical protein
MGAQLRSTVYVKDPDTHQTIELAEGTCPEDRLARLVTNPAAWVDGKLPRLKTGGGAQDPDGGQDDASGDASASDTGNDTAAPAAKKTAAKKTAASSRPRGRGAAGEGDSGD